MFTINWNDLKAPESLNDLLDDMTYINYRSNRERGMSHESLSRVLELSDGKAELYRARFEQEKGNE